MGKVNLEAAVKYLDEHAAHDSTGMCAKAIRLALEAGGLDDRDGHPPAAYLYGPFLQKHGFVLVVDFNAEAPELGDIVVLPALTEAGHMAENPATLPITDKLRYGHICMFDGQAWLSDFRQHDMWGGAPWRAARQFAAYRQV